MKVNIQSFMKQMNTFTKTIATDQQNLRRTAENQSQLSLLPLNNRYSQNRMKTIQNESKFNVSSNRREYTKDFIIIFYSLNRVTAFNKHFLKHFYCLSKHCRSNTMCDYKDGRFLICKILKDVHFHKGSQWGLLNYQI